MKETVRKPTAEQQQAASRSRPSAQAQPLNLVTSLLQLQRTHGNRFVQRMLVQAQRADGVTEALPEVEEAIQRARGSGRPLDSGLRVQMESAFGTDFANVRIHTDAEADTLNRTLGARAFTTSQDIFFRQGEYSSGSSKGQELLAHELTHVVQQTGGLQHKLLIGASEDTYEQEANQVAQKVIGNTALRPDAHIGSETHPSATPGLVSCRTAMIEPDLQKFESPEHVQLGDRAGGAMTGLILLKCHDRDFPQRKEPMSAWPAEWLRLYHSGTADQQRALTRGLTYGEIVALSGDFYTDFEALNLAPLLEIYDLIPLIRSHTTTTTQLQKATGGRYLALARENVLHFSSGPSGRRNMDVWRSMHKDAITAAQGRDSNTAWGLNAAASTTS